MSLSMKMALDLLNQKKNSVTLSELGFILTVFRDNAKHDDVYEFLVACLGELDKQK